MKKLASEVFTGEIIALLREEIEANEDQEVSFVGNVDKYGITYEVEALAYGNDNSSAVVMADTLRGDVLIHNHPSGDIRASGQDINISSLLANKKIGFYIIDNVCEYVNIVVKPTARIFLEEDEIAGIFDGGLLSTSIANFEPRKEQINMVHGVVDAINEAKILSCEAGTGTGKSLSYLIPIAIWAIQNKKRVLVSTHTINLQQQIYNKDMEIASRIVKNYIDKDVNFSVLVGRGNYLCKRKLQDLIRDRDKQTSLFEDEMDSQVLIEIGEWSKKAIEGTRTEFGHSVKRDIWEEVASDGMNCAHKSCPYYKECFYYTARLQAEKSHIIIANHSLVFSSISGGGFRKTIPHFAGIVFDEAHHLEDVALKSRSQDFSMLGVMYHLRKLYNFRRGSEYGQLVFLRQKGGFDSHPELREAFAVIIDMVRDLKTRTQDAHTNIRNIIESMSDYLGNYAIDDKFIKTKNFKTIFKELTALMDSIKEYIVRFEKINERIKDLISDEAVLEILRAIPIRNLYLDEIRQTYELIFKTENSPEFVKWIEITKKNIRFAYSPLEVGDFIANSIFGKKEFTIMTSATLMINHSFEYFNTGVGLYIATDREKNTLALASPFNYKKQAEIFILKENVSHTVLSDEKTQLVRELSLISEGGVLALFTSYKRLREMYDLLKDDLSDNGLYPIRQGDKSREELLKIMQKKSYAVLFATSSFWEGIDIPGHNLRCVIIEKLPFDNISDPIYCAKVKLLESRGENAFMGYSLPRAVLRLKQGLGRLIRSKTDKGIIAIMDNRIKTKRYGSIFLNSLPPSKILYSSVDLMAKAAETFFAGNYKQAIDDSDNSSDDFTPNFIEDDFSTDTNSNDYGNDIWAGMDTYRKWTDSEDAKLRSTVDKGLNVEEIAKSFGRSVVDIKARIKSFGI